jgi:serine/threonine protein kinase
MQNVLTLIDKLSEYNITPSILRTPMQTPNNLHLFIELCNCGSLEYQVKKQKRLTEDCIRRVVKGVVELLEKLYNEKYFYLFLDPSHILIHEESEGRVVYKLIGMKYIKEKEERKLTIPESEYNAPELSKGNFNSHKSQIWSLGLIIYYMTLGFIPSQTGKDFIKRRKKGESIKFPTEIKLSNNLKDLIHNCLRYKHKERIELKEILKHPFMIEDTTLEKSTGYSESSKEEKLTKKKKDPLIKTDLYCYIKKLIEKTKRNYE